jgi:hypothetical protein
VGAGFLRARKDNQFMNHLRRSYRFGLLGLLWLAVAGAGLCATDFSTVNREAVGRFWSALESSNRPVTVVSFGDSMADSYRSVTFHLMNRLIVNHGSAGYSLNNYKNTAMWQLENGASNRGPDYFWFCGYQQVPPGGAMWWANQPTPNGVLCDQAGIYFVSQTNGGQFRLLISTNGGPWSPVFTLNGYSEQPQGHFTNVTLPLNRYRLRVEGDTGTNFIVGPSAIATSTSGIHAVYLDWPGIALNQVTNVPATIREPIFAALNPDLLIWHMKEPLGPSLVEWMNRCEEWWQKTAPDCEVLYIGTPWVIESSEPHTEPQNEIVRNIAVAHDRAYVDLMTPTISYNWLVSQGYMLDGVHLSSAGGLFCANLLWNDLGFYAIGVERRVTLQSAGAQLELSYPVTTNAIYRLEVSTNLTQWTGVLTNPVGAGLFTTNIAPASGPEFYRVNLAPR